MISATETEDQTNSRTENEHTVSQLYYLTIESEKADNYADKSAVCDKPSFDGNLTTGGGEILTKEQKHSESLGAIDGSGCQSQNKEQRSEITKRRSVRKSFGDKQLTGNETVLRNHVCGDGEARRKIVSAAVYSDGKLATQEMAKDFRQSFPRTRNDSVKNQSLSTPNENCDQSLNLHKKATAKSDATLRSDKLLEEYSKMEVMDSKCDNLASGCSPDTHVDVLDALPTLGDKCEAQLATSSGSSDTCSGGKEIHSTVQEISDVLLKCESLLQNPSDSSNFEIENKNQGAENKNQSVKNKNKIADNCGYVDLSNRESSHHVSPEIMGGNNSSEKLEQIRERSKLHEKYADTYVGAHYEGAEAEKTSDQDESCQRKTSTLYPEDNQGSGIKGASLQNAENDLFEETAPSGSIHGNYEESHQTAANVSQEFNHLGKHGNPASASDISATADVFKTKHDSSLSCSQNTDRKHQKDKSSSSSNQNVFVRQSFGDSVFMESKDQSEIMNSPEGQGRSEGHNTCKETNEVTLRKDILRSPKLRSPKMSPLLKDRRFRHGTAGSADSGSGSDQESVEDSEDDDDAGIYGESHRNSRWLYCGDNEDLTVFTIDIDIDGKDPEEGDTCAGSRLDACGEPQGDQSETNCGIKADQSQDSGLELSEDYRSMPVAERTVEADTSEYERTSTWGRALAKRKDGNNRRHRRTESISTTASELEFRNRYQARTRKLIQRQCSQQAYQRMSERFYENERTVVLEKTSGESTFGFHIKGSQPVIISTVEPGSVAERCQLNVNDVLLAVNDVSVMDATHQEIVKIMAQDLDRVHLVVAADRGFGDEPICCGYLVKQGGSGPFKNWRRRWFVLKDDHCLYYYKTEKDADPLGAILLTNYTITKASELSRKHSFKAVKYGQRTYYFQAESEGDMNRWASAMSASATTTTKTDTWLDISSHNVGLSALSIKHPDCHGYLTKMGNRRKNWKRRYCVLKDACLYYYLDVTSTTAQGVAHLHGYLVNENLPTNRKNGITLHPPEHGMRTFYFSAENDTDKKRWVKAFRSSIGRWVRADDF